MEVLSKHLPDACDYRDRQNYVLGETAPYALMLAARCLGRRGRPHFPMLDLVGQGSSAYVDEVLWLDSAAVRQLLEEFRRLRRVCRWEEFIPGISADQVFACWLDGDDIAEFDEQFVTLDNLLCLAAENGHWLLLEL